MVLHRRRDLAHQAQVSRHPARTTTEPCGQLLPAQSVALAQLAQEPPGLQRAQRRRLALPTVGQERLRFRDRPHHRRHRVPAQPAQSTQPPVPVDHHIAAWLLRQCHHHDRHLLAALRQRPQQPALRLRTPHAQRLVAQVELMDLKLQCRSRGRPPSTSQACPAPDLVFSRQQEKSRRAANGIRHLRADLVFRGRGGMSAGFLKPGGHLAPHLVFRVRDHDLAQHSQKGRPRRLELVLRDVPRQAVEGRQRPRRLRSLLLAPPLNPPSGCVVPITPPPRRLRRRPPTLLAHRRRTGALPLAYSNVRGEPTTTEPARPTPAHPCIVGGSLLASSPGSLLASARGY